MNGFMLFFVFLLLLSVVVGTLFFFGVYSKEDVMSYYRDLMGLEDKKEDKKEDDSLPINDNEVVSSSSEVFHVKDNIFKKEDAEAVCKAYDSEVATLSQLEEAYKQGAEWCSYGWTEDGGAYYPTQEETYLKLQKIPERRDECGVPGVNGGMFSKEGMLFGVNCYGPKPVPKEGDKINEKLDPLEVKVNSIRVKKDTLKIAPFSQTKWSSFQ